MIHAIRLGTHAEKQYLSLSVSLFDEVLVNANLMEAGPGSTALFIVSLGKPYMLDPVSYSFAQNPEYLMSSRRSELKRTFRALIHRFGEPLAVCAEGSRAVLASDFADSDKAEGFCRRVLDYQRTRVVEALRENEAFLDEVALEEVPPERLIAPYFHNDERRTWLAVNRRLAEAGAGLAGEGENLCVAVAFDALMLDRREEVDALAETYEGLDCAGYLFWPSDFDETGATVGQIKGLRRLVTRLCGENGEGMMLYGGYFTALLEREGITATSHGVGYGEKRDIVPVVGGGLPPAKYYLQAIHDRIRIEEMLRLAEAVDDATFLREICRCTICSGLIERGGMELLRREFGATEERPYRDGYRNVATSRVYKLTRFHYIENKHRELQEIEGGTRESLVAGLEESYDRFSPTLGRGRLGYLLRWQRGLVESLG